jgi:precorrin-3B methylase
MRGSLIVVGSGISSPAHVTTEAISHIENAERVFSIVADQLTEYWLRSINPRTESFASLYAIGKPRLKTYAEMVERVVGAVKDGFRVCAVAYGHPGVAAYPLHAAIRELRESGYAATMLPGISAEDCLFADLGIAPVTFGCQSFEATDFLMRQRPLDISFGRSE